MRDHTQDSKPSQHTLTVGHVPPAAAGGEPDQKHGEVLALCWPHTDCSGIEPSLGLDRYFLTDTDNQNIKPIPMMIEIPISLSNTD